MTEDEQPEDELPEVERTDEDRTDEDLIESEAPSARESELRRRFDLLVPLTVGRKRLAAMLIAVLALGLVAGFLVGGQQSVDRVADTATEETNQPGVPPEGQYIPIVPDGPPQAVVTVWSDVAGSLTIEDLAGLGETALPGAQDLNSVAALDGLCGISVAAGPAPTPRTPYSSAGGPFYVSLGFGSLSFRLAGATLVERMNPARDVLAAAAQLHGAVELARSCPSSAGLTVSTEGLQAGIGEEYALLTVSRPDPTSGVLETSVVVLVRVRGQLLEVALNPEGGTEVPDGVTRALAIAEVAVARMLAR